MKLDPCGQPSNATTGEVVYYVNLIMICKEPVAYMRTDESCTAGNEYSHIPSANQTTQVKA
jgi:hypothetical protein